MHRSGEVPRVHPTLKESGVRVFLENPIFQRSLEGRLRMNYTKNEKVLQSKYLHVRRPRGVKRQNTPRKQTQGESGEI